jgi:predicted RNase H-like HicB family nuclease
VAHYVAIIEDAGPEYAVGVWFPDLPGCTSAGDDIDEALRNAPEALELYAESFEADGKPMPRPRTLTELKADPENRGRHQNLYGRARRISRPRPRGGMKAIIDPSDCGMGALLPLRFGRDQEANKFPRILANF